MFASSRVAVALVVIVSTSFRAADAPAMKPYWKITGTLEEACSCSAACPCWFNSMAAMQGGEIVAEGPPEKVCEVSGSHTGQFLGKVLDRSTVS